MQRSARPLLYFSYRLKGSTEHARRLAKALREEGSVDVLVDADIPPGSHWPSVLQDGLDRATAVLIFIDADWLHYQDEWGRRRLDNPEDWVHREVEHALTRVGQVLPILVEDARMPPKRALPEALAQLAEVQAARLRLDSFDDDAAIILDWAANLGSTRSLGPAAKGLGASTTRGGSSLLLGRQRVRGMGAPDRQRLRLRSLSISGFRCFEDLEIEFARESTLSGDWTCIAGLNGAGKTSILQAISLLMMGPVHALQLGLGRLKAMRRQDASRRQLESVLGAKVELDGKTHYLEISLTEKGPRTSPNDASSEKVWDALSYLPIVSYGASRNLSDSPDRWDSVSEIVQAQISLFDPLARLVRAEEILEKESPAARRLFIKLVERIFEDEGIKVDVDSESQEGTLRFITAGKSWVSAHQLPDGFRSSVAWMAHFCARCGALRQSVENLDEISGLVMIDEIDLHLHASLQRKIIPSLREALPNVQFIVTSHSPLILSSFDRNELVLLDRDASGGVRELDRQIFAFSADDVYNWLMGTSPSSAVLDKKIAEKGGSGLEVLLYQSPDCDENQALERRARQEAILQKMGFGDGTKG